MSFIIKTILVKVIIGMIFGFIIDFIYRDIKDTEDMVSYEISDKEEISLSETFNDYSKAENNDLMLAQDLTHTMSLYFSGDPSEKWQYSVKNYKIENDRISFSISIINSQSKDYELLLEVDKLLYTQELISFEETNKTLVFLPVGVEYDETINQFVYTDDLWEDTIWTINEYEIEDGKIVEENIINYEWVYKPITLDILLDKLCYLTIYPHYFEQTQILE